MDYVITAIGRIVMPYITIRLNAQRFAEKTSDTELTVEMKTFYHKRLLDNAMPELIMEQGLQKVPIPKNNGKEIEFRRPVPFPVATTPLTEGSLPPAQKLKFENIKAQVYQFGAYTPYTDMVATTTYDPFITVVSEESGSQMGRTRDSLVRDMLCGGTNVKYAGDALSRAEITKSATVADFQRIWAQLKAKNVPAIDGWYLAKIHPDVAVTLMQDERWIGAHQYTDSTPIMRGEIGSLVGFRFIVSSQAKVYAPAKVCGTFNRLTVQTAATSGTSVKINEIIPQADCTAFTGPVDVYVDGAKNKVTAVTYGADGATLTLQTAVTVAVGKMICGTGAGKNGDAVYASIIHGANAAATCDLEGQGMKLIVKPLGYNDALDLEGSVGWKFAAAMLLLSEPYIVRYESVEANSQTAVEN